MNDGLAPEWRAVLAGNADPFETQHRYRALGRRLHDVPWPLPEYHHIPAQPDGSLFPRRPTYSLTAYSIHSHSGPQIQSAPPGNACHSASVSSAVFCGTSSPGWDLTGAYPGLLPSRLMSLSP